MPVPGSAAGAVPGAGSGAAAGGGALSLGAGGGGAGATTLQPPISAASARAGAARTPARPRPLTRARRGLRLRLYAGTRGGEARELLDARIGVAADAAAPGAHGAQHRRGDRDRGDAAVEGVPAA